MLSAPGLASTAQPWKVTAHGCVDYHYLTGSLVRVLNEIRWEKIIKPINCHRDKWQ